MSWWRVARGRNAEPSIQIPAGEDSDPAAQVTADVSAEGHEPERQGVTDDSQGVPLAAVQAARRLLGDGLRLAQV